MGQIQTKNKKLKNKKNPKFGTKEYFIKNGGILLEKQIALNQGRHIGAGELKIFSLKDIEKATHNFDSDHLICSSTHRKVYEGGIEDRRVSIKAPAPLLEPHPKLIDRCSTEAATAMVVMNHSNMAKIYGCCLETFIPILVYEFVPNGSLFEHLHGDTSSTHRIKWVDRLKVATDTAYALAYMHNALSKPVVHRDINSYIILLEYSFHAKLSNFGCSLPITPGDKSQRWPVEGTPGYIDPVYIETLVVTDKSDVYSFGVLMLELLTRREPRKMAREGTDLVDVFVAAVEKNCLMEMIDCEVLEQTSEDEIQGVAQLALTCVAKERTERPTMTEVVLQLWHRIRKVQESKVY